MAWVNLRFVVQGEVQVSRAFQVSERRAQDLSEPLRDIGDSLLETVQRQFDSQGAFGLGRRWHALSPAYRAWKQQHFPDTAHLILIRTGAMREAMESEQALTVSPRRLVYEPRGERADIAAIHQAGEGHMPQRKIVAIPEQVARDWERAFLEWLRSDPLWPAGR